MLISIISVLLHFWVFSTDCTIHTQRKRLDFFDVITRFIVINKPHMNDWLCALTTEPQKTSTKRKSFTLVIWHIGNKSQDGQPAKNSTKRRLTTSKKWGKECRVNKLWFTISRKCIKPLFDILAISNTTDDPSHSQ